MIISLESLISSPVKGDQTEVHDGGSTEEDVQSPVNIAPDTSEHPVAEQLGFKHLSQIEKMQIMARFTQL